jgi:hypothetical protein
VCPFGHVLTLKTSTPAKTALSTIDPPAKIFSSRLDSAREGNLRADSQSVASSIGFKIHTPMRFAEQLYIITALAQDRAATKHSWQSVVVFGTFIRDCRSFVADSRPTSRIPVPFFADSRPKSRIGKLHCGLPVTISEAL